VRFYFFASALSLFLLLSACEKHRGYERIGEGIYLKRISFDENALLHKGDRLLELKSRFFMQDKEIKERLFFKNEAGFDTIETPLLPEALKKAFNKLQTGDSIHLIIEDEAEDRSYFHKILPPESHEPLELHLRVVHAEPLPFSTQKIIEKEEEAIMRFIQKSGQKWEALPSGIYINRVYHAEAELPKAGDRLQLNYTGKFLNGRIFDDFGQRGQWLEYSPGTQNQLIRGLEIAVSQLTPGSKARIIIPWKLAFGEQGSSTGIVKPYKTVIFELELKKNETTPL
jgi:FKBP-type peptidyl-prolyl cis-trans isomerase